MAEPMGFFTDTTLNNAWLDLDFASGGKNKIVIPGDGEQKVSFTTIPDVARAVAATLVDFDAYKNKNVCIEGDRKTFNEIVSIYKTTKNNIDVSYVSTSQLRESVKQRQHAFDKVKEQLLLVLANGASLHAEAKVDKKISASFLSIQQYIDGGFKTNSN